MYIDSVSSFLKFGGQTSKNVHGVRKVCLETSLRVYVCFVEFCVFVLDETHVVGSYSYASIFGLKRAGTTPHRTHKGP